MTTLMLSPQASEDSQRLRAAALQLGWKVVRWSSWHKPPGLPEHDLCLYASPLFGERVSQLTGLQLAEPPDDWLTHLPEELLKRTVTLTTLEQARQREERLFYKPAAFKTFPAGVYQSGRELPGPEQADGDNPVLLSDVVHWESEFRFFLLDGHCLTGSVYYRNGQSGQVGTSWPSEPEEYQQARKAAESAYSATSDRLPRSVVIDTGFIRDKGWAVIEANPSWGSGIYGSEPEQVLRVIAEAVVSL